MSTQSPMTEMLLKKNPVPSNQIQNAQIAAANDPMRRQPDPVDEAKAFLATSQFAPLPAPTPAPTPEPGILSGIASMISQYFGGGQQPLPPSTPGTGGIPGGPPTSIGLTPEEEAERLRKAALLGAPLAAGFQALPLPTPPPPIPEMPRR